MLKIFQVAIHWDRAAHTCFQWLIEWGWWSLISSGRYSATWWRWWTAMAVTSHSRFLVTYFEGWIENLVVGSIIGLCLLDTMVLDLFTSNRQDCNLFGSNDNFYSGFFLVTINLIAFYKSAKFTMWIRSKILRKGHGKHKRLFSIQKDLWKQQRLVWKLCGQFLKVLPLLYAFYVLWETSLLEDRGKPSGQRRARLRWISWCDIYFEIGNYTMAFISTSWLQLYKAFFNFIKYSWWSHSLLSNVV